MKKFFAYIYQHHQEIFRISLMLIVVLFITNWFPKTGGFQYDFEIGKPWPYEDLIAPVSFPVKKPEAELQLERDKIESEVKPYLQVDDAVGAEAKSNYREEIKRAFEKIGGQVEGIDLARDSSKVINLGLRILDRIYSKGVFHLSGTGLTLGPDDEVNLVIENTSKPVRYGRLHSAVTAVQYIDDTLGALPDLKTTLAPILKNLISPNVAFDSVTTRKLREEAFNEISLYRGAVQEDEAIIRYGEIVTEEKGLKISSYNDHLNSQLGNRNRILVLVGYFVLAALLMSIFAIFLTLFAPDVFASTRKLLFILLLIALIIYIVSWGVQNEIPSYYVIPYCIVPIILRTFFGTRLALYAHLMVVLLSSFIVPLGIEYTCLNIVAGMVAIFTNIKAHYWSQFFVSIAFIFLTYSVGFFGIALIQEGNLLTMKWIDFGWLFINVFLTLMAYPLIPIFEKLFGYVSDITLIELGDLGKPLLKDLQLKAPGTFQHSLQVANLAEAAASEIGANALLVKVGSLYHDIGKMNNPVYFIENQVTDYNPHDDLPFEESAHLIISHVLVGIEMAKKHKLPEVLIDFIRTHHGTSRVEYFYRSFIKSFPDKDVDERIFTYPGPLPFSKETAIVMMADSVEAAARSLKQPTQESLDTLVEGIIKGKVDNQQFINSDITFKEITLIKKVFKKILHSIYHVRIEYPSA